MLRRSKLVREINTLEKEIQLLEGKRSRSIAVLLEALISKTVPNETDVQFFRTYSANIEVKREQLQKLYAQLDNLK